MRQQTRGTGEVAQGRDLQGGARYQGSYPVHEQRLPQGTEQAAEHRFDDHVLLHISPPLFMPRTSPLAFPHHTSLTLSVPTVRPAYESRSGETAGGVTWPCAPSAV